MRSHQLQKTIKHRHTSIGLLLLEYYSDAHAEHDLDAHEDAVDEDDDEDAAAAAADDDDVTKAHDR
jgi:hypothetical protein